MEGWYQHLTGIGRPNVYISVNHCNEAMLAKLKDIEATGKLLGIQGIMGLLKLIQYQSLRECAETGTSGIGNTYYPSLSDKYDGNKIFGCESFD